VPGPGQYAIKPAVGPQADSKLHNAPRFGFGTGTREHREKVKGYMVFDADATLDLGALGWDNTILQFNAINLLNESYQGNINSTVNAQTVTKKFADGSNDGTQSGSAPSYSTGAPQTFQIQIKTKF
jgi:hypothetical protein